MYTPYYNSISLFSSILHFQKAKKDVEFGHEQQTRRSSDTTTTIAQSWKFFDPLASPTGEDHEELLRLEAMLDAKAKKANQGLILEARPDIIASTERPGLPRTRPGPSERQPRSRAAPKDIESLISNNLMKLRSLSPSSKAAKATDEGSKI